MYDTDMQTTFQTPHKIIYLLFDSIVNIYVYLVVNEYCRILELNCLRYI